MTHPHDQAPAPLTAEVVAEMADALKSISVYYLDKRQGWVYDLPQRAADMLTALATQLAEREKELARVTAALADPVAVHANMLRGQIAMPSFANIQHLYAADFAERDSRIAALTEALTLARNRMQMCVLDHPANSRAWFERSEWADDATSALTTDKEPAT